MASGRFERDGKGRTMDVAKIGAGEGAFAVEAVVVTMPRGITVTAYSPRRRP